MAVEASEAAATRLIENIKNACKPFLQFPAAAPARESLAKGLRVAFCGAFAIYFVPNARELVIVRVLHGSRDATALLAQSGLAGRGET